MLSGAGKTDEVVIDECDRMMDELLCYIGVAELLFGIARVIQGLTLITRLIFGRLRLLPRCTIQRGYGYVVRVASCYSFVFQIAFDVCLLK